MKFIVEVSDEVLSDYEVTDLMDAISEAVASETGAVNVKVIDYLGEP